ncbi:uncharacterized protein [Anabrus simplex]|uniref:uncharacterized protein n=1 Tax=Anabrus simplex TaxID=316456 RepID=UPI0035A2ED2D
MIKKISRWDFGTSTNKVRQGWVNDIRAIQMLWRKLSWEEGVQKLCIRNLNQDPLENLFGIILQHGCQNTNPTCWQFVPALKASIVNNLLSSRCGEKGNCMDDGDDLLCDLSLFLSGAGTQSSAMGYSLQDIQCFSAELKENAPEDPKLVLPSPTFTTHVSVASEMVLLKLEEMAHETCLLQKVKAYIFLKYEWNEVGCVEHCTSVGILSKSMEEPVFVKCEPTSLLDTEEEPPHLEHSQLVSEMIPLKEETKLELTEPGPTHENEFEPSTDIKEEMFIEQHQPVPIIKEENKLGPEVSCADHPPPDGGRHLKRTEEDRPLICDYCGKLFSSENSLSEHVLIHMEQALHECRICQKTFTKMSNLTVHMGLHTDVTRFQCSVCQTMFRSSSHLNFHMRTHMSGKRYKCNMCFKVFTRKYRLATHLRTHRGERPYWCTTCGKSFNQKGHLTSHMLIHTGEMPFKCNMCGKASNRKGDLTKHLRTHTGEKPHFCNICGKSFSLKTILSRHLRIHTDEKPFCCNTCGKAFRNETNLAKHMPTHSQLKPYFCNVCGKAFSLKAYLPKHLQSHTGFKPYNCNICSKSFSQKAHLTNHILTHNGTSRTRAICAAKPITSIPS